MQASCRIEALTRGGVTANLTHHVRERSGAKVIAIRIIAHGLAIKLITLA